MMTVWSSFGQSIRACLSGAFIGFALIAVPSLQAAPRVFQFTSTLGGTTDNATTLDQSFLNHKPNLKLIITQSGTNTLNNHPVGVHYDSDAKKWQVVNEDGAAMPIGAVFNVLVPTIGFQVNAGPQNSESAWTFFNMGKGKPDSVLLATHIDNPFPKLSAVHLNHNIGLYYIEPTVHPTHETGLWSVFNEDETAPIATSYFLADVTKDSDPSNPSHSFVVTASAANTTANGVVINDSLANNNPNAILFTISNYNPSGAFAALFDKVIGVCYSGTNWMIFAEDGTTIPAGVSFNVEVFSAASR